MREVQLAAIVQEDSPFWSSRIKLLPPLFPSGSPCRNSFPSSSLGRDGRSLGPFPMISCVPFWKRGRCGWNGWRWRRSKKAYSTRGFWWEKTGKSPKLWMRGLPMPLLWPCGWGPDFCGGRSVRPGGGSSGTRANCLRAPNPSKLKTIFGASGKGVPGPQEG